MSRKKREAKPKAKDLVAKKQSLEEGYVIADTYASNNSRIKTIINWLREGKTDVEIMFLILEIFKIKENSAKTYLASAKSCFKNELILDRKFNIVQHIKRYDRDINACANYKPKTNSYAQEKILKTKSYLDMVNLLQKKERVLGFHQKQTQIRIRNNVQINIVEVKKNFDFSNLTLEEKIEFFHLLEKTKIVDEERFAIKLNPKKIIIQKKTEDIDHEVIEEKSIFDEIKIEYEPPIPEIKPPRPHIGNDANVIDTVKKEDNSINTNLDDIKNKMLKNLFKK